MDNVALLQVKACLTDAVAEIGPALAEKMGLFRTSRPDFARTRLFYHAVQFRGILQVGDTAVLVKGMLVVNPSLGNKLVLRRSCVKCQWQPDSDSGLTYGLDVVQTTYGTQGRPELHSQLASALAMWACLHKSLSARRQAESSRR